MKDRTKNKVLSPEAYRDKEVERKKKKLDEVADEATSEGPTLDLGALLRRAQQHAVRQYAQKLRERRRQKTRRASRKKNRAP